MRNDDSDETVVDALLPREVAPKGFDLILSHLIHEFNATVTKRTFDTASNEDVLIFAYIACFLNIALSNTNAFDSNH